MNSQLQVICADITKLHVDAIVNAANHTLLGGGGVDGAIHRAAGPELVKECYGLGGCRTGEAKLTGGYQLPAKYVIHTVGPIYYEDEHPAERLADCYRNSLMIAINRGLKTIAFPCISTGVYGYPADEAAHIAVSTVRSVLSETGSNICVTFCCFGTRDEALYRALLNA